MFALLSTLRQVLGCTLRPLVHFENLWKQIAKRLVRVCHEPASLDSNQHLHRSANACIEGFPREEEHIGLRPSEVINDGSLSRLLASQQWKIDNRRYSNRPCDLSK